MLAKRRFMANKGQIGLTSPGTLSGKAEAPQLLMSFCWQGRCSSEQDTAGVSIPMQAPDVPIRVIVVDHRSIVRSALGLLVAGRSEYAVVATIGKDAVSVDAALRQHPDVALLHMGADTDRDLALVVELRDATPSVRVLLLTETADRDLHQEAIRMGAYGVMSPECSPDTLLRALECICRGEYWIDRATAAALASASRMVHGAAPGSDKAAALTARERSILSLIVDGLRNKEIAACLNISETTVRHHLTSIFAKFGVSDRLALAVYAFRNRLVTGAPPRDAGRQTRTPPALSSLREPALAR
jgi:DNA-binding NarL/FixJ family response regulator